MRKQRSALSAKAQQQAAWRLRQQLLTLPEIRRARSIAAYWASDGEINPLPALRALAQLGKRLYMPVVLVDGQLHFKRVRLVRGMRKNRYGIPEPVGKRRAQPQRLDMVLMPLVAFDAAGCRLGMGGGYYDRTFAFKRLQPWRRKPRLVGLAHAFQQVQQLQSDSWDVPVSAIVTDKSVFRVR